MDTSEQAALALRNLPPFPPIAGKVISLLGSESFSFK
jgi:hypothetical protein